MPAGTAGINQPADQPPTKIGAEDEIGGSPTANSVGRRTAVYPRDHHPSSTSAHGWRSRMPLMMYETSVASGRRTCGRCCCRAARCSPLMPDPPARPRSSIRYLPAGPPAVSVETRYSRHRRPADPPGPPGRRRRHLRAPPGRRHLGRRHGPSAVSLSLSRTGPSTRAELSAPSRIATAASAPPSKTRSSGPARSPPFDAAMHTIAPTDSRDVVRRRSSRLQEDAHVNSSVAMVMPDGFDDERSRRSGATTPSRTGTRTR